MSKNAASSSSVRLDRRTDGGIFTSVVNMKLNHFSLNLRFAEFEICM